MPNGGSSDILWQASIDDQTGVFFDEFDRRVMDADDAADKSFGNIDKSVVQTGAEIGIVAGIVMSLTQKLIMMGSQAVSSIKNFVTESINLRARADTLAVSLNLVGRNAGYSAGEIAAAEESVKSMGITTISARQSLILLSRANIDWSEASKLARIAQDAAVLAGLNSSQAFERLVRGIQKQEPELLDELGLTLTRSDAYAVLAKELGITTKAMTHQQKQQAILNDIYRQSGLVAGAYEAAMGTVGKTMKSLDRLSEELQLAIGGIFQLAFGEQIAFMTEKFKEMQEWTEENVEALEHLGEIGGDALGLLFDALDDIIGVIGKIPGGIGDLGTGFAKMIANIIEGLSGIDVAVEEDSTKMAEYFGQAITLIAGFFAAGVVSIVDSIKIVWEALGMLSDILTGVSDIMPRILAIQEIAASMADDTMNAFRDVALAVGEWTGVIDENVESLEEQEEQIDEVTDAIEEQAAAMENAADALEALEGMWEAGAAERAVEDYRSGLAAMIRLGHRLEDIAERHARRIETIRERYAAGISDAIEDAQRDELELLERAAEDRFDLEQNTADRLLDIEVGYNRTLQDIRRAFEYDAVELVRKRDAIGLLRLMRATKRKEEEARVARNRGRTDATTDHARRLRDLERSLERERRELAEDLQERLEMLGDNLEEQLEDAEDARQRDYDNLDRSLRRKQQLELLHAGWREQDRRTAQQQEILDIITQQWAIENLTASYLSGLLMQYGAYYTDLNDLIADFIRAMVTGGTFDWFQDYYPGPNPAGAVTGQAGQVSQMLAEPAQYGMFTQGNVSPLPAVSSSRSHARKDIHVTVDGTGLNPYIQRQVAMALMEIERNAP